VLSCAVALLVVAYVASTSDAQTLPTQPTAQDLQIVESGKKFSQNTAITDWLGPLTPIALSPFFGLACLSGLATFGPEWLQKQSSMFGGSSMLNNPLLFWTMIILTVVTSLPRLSKVSKPIALASEKLETYSVIIIVIAMRVFSSSGMLGTESVALNGEPLLSAGIATMPIDMLIAIASAINILVINGVKLFFEFIVWLTPIPAIDALVEVLNKSLCVALVGLYAWSPFLATALNLLILAACGCIFLWTQRRLAYYVDLIMCPILSNVLGGLVSWRFTKNADGELAFLAIRWKGLPPYTRLRLKGSASEGWTVTRHTWWSRLEYAILPSPIQSTPGLFTSTVEVGDGLHILMIGNLKHPKVTESLADLTF